MKRFIQFLWLTAAIIAILTISFTVSRGRRQESDTYLLSFAENLDNFEDGSICNLPDVTPWEWDYVYFIQPGTTQKQAEKIIGFSTETVLVDKSSLNEGYMIFTFGDKVAEVMKFYSPSCTFIIDAGSFFYDAVPGEYVKFSLFDEVVFTKTSQNIGGSPWATLILMDDIGEYIYS